MVAGKKVTPTTLSIVSKTERLRKGTTMSQNTTRTIHDHQVVLRPCRRSSHARAVAEDGTQGG